MVRFTFQWTGISDLGDITMDVPDHRAPAVAEALEELGFEDAKMEKL